VAVAKRQRKHGGDAVVSNTNHGFVKSLSNVLKPSQITGHGPPACLNLSASRQSQPEWMFNEHVTLAPPPASPLAAASPARSFPVGDTSLPAGHVVVQATPHALPTSSVQSAAM
jgi:hypothetical protein